MSANVSGDPFGHGTHVAGMIGGAGSAAARVTAAYTGGSAPAVRFIDVRVLGRTGVGYTSDVLAGIDWAIANRTKLRHPRHQPLARASGCRARGDRSAVHRGRARGQGRHRRRRLRRQLWRDANWRPGSRRDYFPGKFACRDHRGRRSTPRALPIESDDVVAPYSSKGPTRFDFAVKPDVVAPGTRIVSLERERVLHRHDLSAVPRRRHRQERVPPPERHEHGDRRRQRRRRAAARMRSPSLSPAQVKDRAADWARASCRSAGLIAAGTGSVDFAQTLEDRRAGSHHRTAVDPAEHSGAVERRVVLRPRAR